MDFRRDKIKFSCCNVLIIPKNKGFDTTCPKCKTDYKDHPFFFMNLKKTISS